MGSRIVVIAAAYYSLVYLSFAIPASLWLGRRLAEVSHG